MARVSFSVQRWVKDKKQKKNLTWQRRALVVFPPAPMAFQYLHHLTYLVCLTCARSAALTHSRAVGFPILAQSYVSISPYLRTARATALTRSRIGGSKNRQQWQHWSSYVSDSRALLCHVCA
eukprot:3867952-Pyramimonas_sp.AAC.1